MTTKSPTSWIPQPEGFGYIITQTNLNLETKTLLNLETKALLPLQTAAYKVTGKNPTTWSATGS